MNFVELASIPTEISQYMVHAIEKRNFPIEFSNVEILSDDVWEKADIIRINPDDSSLYLQESLTIDSKIHSVNCFDTFIKQRGQWIPRLLLYDSLNEAYVKYIHYLNIRKPAIISGNGALAQIAVAQLFGAGFNLAYLVYQDIVKAEAIKKQIEQRYLGCQVCLFPEADLTLSTIDASILVNTVKFKDNKALLGDLSYFNYLSKKAIIVDMEFNCNDESLYDEAQKAQLKFIHPHVIYSYYHMQIFRLFYPEIKINIEEYIEEFKTFLSSKNRT